MSSILPFLIPALVILFLAIRRAPNNQTPPVVRPDFIAQASKSRFVSSDLGAFTPVRSKSSDFNYDVVGESFQRDNLMALIRAHKAFETGEIYTTAVLEPEPTNAFDSTAVKVVIEGMQVGYIAKFDSAAVTKMIKKSGKNSYEVPAKIGFDADSPAPLIGVKIALTVE
jgi:hypothetical protein